MNLMNVVGMAQLSLYMIATSVKQHSLHNWIAHYPEQLTIAYIKGWQVLEHCHQTTLPSIVLIRR